MPYHSETVDKAAGALGLGGGGAVAADAAEGNGLDRIRGGLDVAAQAAGDVLRGIFGGLPWEMSPGEIVDAVTGGLAGGANESAAMLVPYLPDLLGVVA